MDKAVEAVFAEYDARAERESQAFRKMAAGERFDRDALLLSVGRDTGSLLNTLIKGARSQSILELGTSYGYSTVWLAEAARETGGRVISMDVAPQKQEYAARMLAKAGLAGQVEFRSGDVLELLPSLAAGVDFVLLDIWKDVYIPCFDLLVPKLAPGAIVVADNMLQPTAALEQARAYRRHVHADPRFSTVLLPVGSGIEISRMKGPDDTRA